MSDPAEFRPRGADAEQETAMAAEWEAALAQQATTPSGGDGLGPVQRPPPAKLATLCSRPRPQRSPISGASSLSMPAGNDINMILDIPVQLTVELGRTRFPIKNILQLAQGSVVELDALAGEPDGRAGQRLPDCAGRGGGGERQVRVSA